MDWEDFMKDERVQEIFKEIRVYESKNQTCYVLTDKDEELLNEIYKENGDAKSYYM